MDNTSTSTYLDWVLKNYVLKQLEIEAFDFCKQ